MGVLKNHKDLNRYFKELIVHKKIKITSESDNRMMFDVNGTTVVMESKPGATIYTCECQSYRRNCNSPSLCKHRDAARLFLFYQPIFQKLKEVISIADTNHEVQEGFTFDERYRESVLKYLQRKQGAVTKNYFDDFLKENEFTKKLMQEFEYIQRRKPNHHYYKMIIQDVLRAK